MVHLEAYPVWILEQDGVVARRPGSIFGSVHDLAGDPSPGGGVGAWEQIAITSEDFAVARQGIAIANG